MALLTGSEILAKALRKEGTDDLFFIMGGPMLLAEESCIKEGIRPIDVRHEQAAALMGQAYSRLLQKPAVCMAASGPGVINLTTGMANALISISTAEGGPVLILEDVVVAADHRGGGHGRRLVEHVIAWARATGMRRVTLLADKDNAVALAFYQRLGFQDSAMVVRRLPL